MKKSQRSRLMLRLVALATAVYCGLLVIAAWPPVLTPTDTFSGVQTSANLVLSKLGWPSGLGVFSGHGGPPQVDRMTCVRIEGYLPDGSERVLYDTFDHCEQGIVDTIKDRRDHYYEQILRQALPRMRGGGDLNDFRINHLFAISDYHCRQLDPQRPVGSYLVYRAIYITSDLQTGEGSVLRVAEGRHHCAEGKWEPL